MLDLLLIAIVGFLGSFGHCFGMCGPLTVAFSLSNDHRREKSDGDWRQQFQFHFLLNLGRMLSYALVGGAIGGLGSILFQGGQLAGIGSDLRRYIAVITGVMLIWFGLGQIKPNWLPTIPLLHPLLKSSLHDRLSAGMLKLSWQQNWWTPILLGMTWGLMPCGFLYAAQIKAAETSNLWMGAATMLAFGAGTLPTMLGVGVSTSLISKDKRSQLFRLAGWVTLAIGIITILRTGDTMVDYTGHAALFCLMLALIARPISNLANQNYRVQVGGAGVQGCRGAGVQGRNDGTLSSAPPPLRPSACHHTKFSWQTSNWWAAPMRYRRAIGVGAFVLSIVHTTHMIEHSLQWNFAAFWFFPAEFRWGMAAGAVALILMTPAALTSWEALQKSWGKRWRQIHLLSVPALLLSVFHAALIGSHYLGNQLATVLLVIATLGVLLLRWAIPIRNS